MKKILFVLATLALAFVSLDHFKKPIIDDIGGYTGGYINSTDRTAPKTIKSKEITAFEYSFFIYWPEHRYGRETLYHHCDFRLVREEEGARCTGSGYSRYSDGNSFNFEFVAPLSSLDELHEILDEHKVANSNGMHERTIGIPEGQGGEVRVRYASGERISAYNNAGPVMRDLASAALYDFFIDLAMSEDPEMMDSGDKYPELYKLLHQRLETEDGKHALEFTHSEIILYEGEKEVARGEYVVVGDELPLQIQDRNNDLAPYYFFFTWEEGHFIGVESRDNEVEFFPRKKGLTH